jgi:PAS domain S-box-containing protein
MGNRDTVNDQLVRAVMGLGQHVAELLSSGDKALGSDEVARRNLAEKYRSVMSAITDGYFEADAAGNLLFCNQALCEIVGHPMEKLVGSDYRCFIDIKASQKLRLRCMRIWLARPLQDEVDCEIVRPDGIVRLISMSIVPMANASDEPVGFSGVVRDVTAERQADQELQLMQFSIENSVEATYLIGPDARFLYVNNAACDALGYTREELLGLSLRDIDKSFTAEAWKAAREQRPPGQSTTFESYHQRKDGTVIPVEIKTSFMEFCGRKYACAFARDITERKRAQEKLALLQFSIDHAGEAIFLLDGEARFIYANEAACNSLGYTREELLGLHLSAVDKSFSPEMLQRAEAQSKVENSVTLETFHHSRDGRTIPVEVRATRYLEFGGKKYVCAFARDISERKQKEEELYLAREAAEAASRAKSEFLANMSHEIRTPMNGVIGMTELALETPLSSEQREYLGMVKTSADSLLSVINDILDFSKIEAGKLDLNPISFQLRDSIHETVRVFAMRAQQKGLELTLDIAPETPDDLMGDPGRLRQVVTNLLGNAIKFTPQGKIDLQVSVQAPGPEDVLLHFAVVDTGIGIPAEKQWVIFDAFSQIDGSTTRNYGGSGLGLAICSKLVTMMGGRIWVDSQLGKGSTFHFTARFGLQGRTLTSGRLTRLAESVIFDAARAGNLRQWDQKLPLRKDDLPTGAQGYRVLLAEDDEISQKLTVRLLQNHGYTVVTAGNGREALAAFDAQPFDLILMDVQMPELNGYEVTSLIRDREKPGAGRTPIVALTANAMNGDRERCLGAGMDGYLSKPINKNELIDVLRQFTLKWQKA